MEKYQSHISGWYNFQVDLGMDMMQYTIELEWKEPYEQEVKLAWMHQNPLDPCKCSQCFFCGHRMITGVIHKPKTVRRNFQLVAKGHSQVHEKVIKTSAWDCQCHDHLRHEFQSLSSEKIKRYQKKPTKVVFSA